MKIKLFQIIILILVLAALSCPLGQESPCLAATMTSPNYSLDGTLLTGSGGSSDSESTTMDIDLAPVGAGSDTAYVSAVAILNIKLSSTSINWITTIEMSSKIFYGLTTEYGDTLTATPLTTQHSMDLLDLAQGTTYHIRLGGTDANGKEYLSDDYVFTTMILPKIITYAVESATEDKATFIWETDQKTTSEVEYIHGDTKEKMTKGSTTLSTDHKIEIDKLDPGTLYNIRLYGRNEAGHLAESDWFALITPADALGPIIIQVKTNAATIPGTDERIQAIISWETDEPATSILYFQRGISAKEKYDKEIFDDTLSKNHVMVLTDLKAGQAYRFKVASEDKYGNRSETHEMSLLAPHRRESIFQLIINNFKDIFGWTKRLKF